MVVFRMLASLPAGLTALRRATLPPRAATAVLITFFVLSCGDRGVEPSVPSEPKATRIAITPNPPIGVQLEPGATVQFSAEVQDQNGQAMAGAQVLWSSSNTQVATASASGLVTAVLPGLAEIEARSGSVAEVVNVTVATRPLPSDRARKRILTALYEATNGDHWSNNTNWLSGAPPGAWSGVNTGAGLGAPTSRVEQPVIQIVLQENNLAGPIPPELGNLPKLTDLWLGDNQLTGPIPSELGNLLDLQELLLHHNQLTGPIPPELGSLTNLERLWLDENNLTGPIPPELGSLRNLERLLLHDNQLTGPIPPELGSLAVLEDLWLHDNQLTGPIPSELASLPNLKYLGLDDNNLTGPIPPELAGLTNLEGLFLWSNQLTGPIPSELGSLPNLEGLWLWSNQLTGPIPSELGSLPNLKYLALDHNNLTGPIPSELANLVNLENLRLDGNQLTGPIPSELGSLTNLKSLSLANNNLTGQLPESLLTLGLMSFNWYGNAGLCAPDTAAFRAWLSGIQYHGPGPFCSAGG